MQGFPGTFPSGPRVLSVGNPVRAAIAALPAPAARGVGNAGGPMRLLVLGGSQGARALNSVVPAALAQLGPDFPIQVLHQCGAAHREATDREYTRRAIRGARVLPFIDDMPAAYAQADLAVCRAGALTLAELCAAGLGAILIPYPHAADDHQAANARHVAGAGGAIVVPEQEMDPARLAGLLRELEQQRARLLGLAEAARALARPDAARAVGEVCMEALRA
jgi:UDP-N-acetylglucosamine--N-acetylmuramyl-(pentapeptide) pyrophosphoryl-undecaprenol N-acetylglucosamine transferase